MFEGQPLAGNVEELIRAHEQVKREVYLDLENSSPVAREVVEAMVPYFADKAYGNPTITSKPGWIAYETIMKASEQAAGYIGASSAEEINYTPGETEANNLALVGATLANRKIGNKVVISQIEPLSITFSAQTLERYGFKTAKIPVSPEGLINLDALAAAVDKETVVVSIALANHEIGTIQPIREAAKIVHEKNPQAIFHTDASDSYGKIPMNVKELGVDLMTLSSYKILGPRGIGVLYGKEGVAVERLVEGQIGTQKFWPGVENTPLIMGFLKASELCFSGFEANAAHMKALRNMLIDGILGELSEVSLNGAKGDGRVPDNVNVSVLHCEGEALTIELSLNGIYISSGSACSRRLLQPSHVLTAIGRKFEAAHGSILMKVTRYHTADDIKYVLGVMPRAVGRLRDISPKHRM